MKSRKETVRLDDSDDRLRNNPLWHDAADNLFKTDLNVWRNLFRRYNFSVPSIANLHGDSDCFHENVSLARFISRVFCVFRSGFPKQDWTLDLCTRPRKVFWWTKRLELRSSFSRNATKDWAHEHGLLGEVDSSCLQTEFRLFVLDHLKQKRTWGDRWKSLSVEKAENQSLDERNPSAGRYS